MKRTILLSLLLALVMTKANAYDEVAGFVGPTWYEYRATGYAGGSGSKNDPYLIQTPGQLALLSYQVNVEGVGGYFKLDDNIDLYKYIDSKPVVWIPIGISSEKPFKGILTNPDGHVISNMVIYANSTETTNYFGLFGCVTGTVDGVKLEAGEIEISGLSGEYYAGLLCGYLNKGYVANCWVQGDNNLITAKALSSNSDNVLNIGGLVGENNNDGGEKNRLVSCVVKTAIRLTGNGTNVVRAGGVVGLNYGKMLDCHAIVNMTATNLSTSNDSYLGGVIGFMSKGAVKFCSASGDVTVDANSQAVTGGLMGILEHRSVPLSVKYCATTVAITGGHTLGGLIGYCFSQPMTNTTIPIENNASSSYINARDATYAGGVIGHLKRFANDSGTLWLGQHGCSNSFCGTMTKPTSSNYYGTILGYSTNVSEDNYKNLWGGIFYYSPMMCNMQTNGMGWQLGASTGQNAKLIPYSGEDPTKNEGFYGTYKLLWEYGSLGNPAPTAHYDQDDPIEMCFTDNYVLCDVLFYITNDKKILYSANDVTVDFSIEDHTNSVTGERAEFTVPDNVTCIKVVDKHIYPLDPGEVDVTVKWNGLQRKVHLDITYGKEWTGGPNWVFDGGDGSQANPFMIHNANQLAAAVDPYRKWNKEGEHYYFKLSNDIFFNTHLLQSDGMPRSDARQWGPYDLYLNIDGNGKTMYGVYVNKDNLAAGETLGIFKNLYGTVKNLAIVDSNVSTNKASNVDSSAGLLCGTMKEGASVSNCLFHGRVSIDSYCGGIAALVDGNNTSITDCFTSVHLTWPANGVSPNGAGGVSYDTPATLERCVSVGRVDRFSWGYGISENSDVNNACYFDTQMLGEPKQSYIQGQDDAMTTDELLNNNLMKPFNTWQQEEERYPMLTTFADTPYGKLLTIPVLFDKAEGADRYTVDRAGDVNYIFEFPTEDVFWKALHGQTYIDVINDCGAASIVKETGNDVEILIAEAQNVESQCTRARRTLPLNLRSGLTHFLFKDEVAQAAAETAFDKNQDEILTLRELVEATKDDFAVFNASAKANVKDLKAFPEFRYFTNTQTVEEGMISDLAQLSELQLPKKLTTIAEKAFSGCASLEEITVPATFTTMNEGALYESSIKDIFVNRKHKTMESIDGALFSTDNIGKKHLVIYPPGRGKADATISTLFHFIDDYAFYKVPKLRNIYIDNCLPEGNLVEPEVSEQPIIHENSGEMMDIYVNDGSYQSKLFKDYQNDPYWGTYEDAGHLHIYYPLNVTNAMWATLYIGFPTQLPEGLTAYVATEDVNTAYSQGKDVITLKSIGRVIPATTPVIINAESAGLYPLVLYTGSVPDVEKYKNKFIGTYIGQTEMGKIKWGLDVNQETSASGGTLTLGYNSNGEVGFFKYDGEVIPPYRAYLGYTNLISNARFLFMIEDTFDGIATGVSEAPTDGQTGQAWYTLEGVRLNGKPTQKGIYIVNGKKYYAR